MVTNYRANSPAVDFKLEHHHRWGQVLLTIAFIPPALVYVVTTLVVGIATLLWTALIIYPISKLSRRKDEDDVTSIFGPAHAQPKAVTRVDRTRNDKV